MQVEGPQEPMIRDRKEVHFCLGRKPVTGYYIAPTADGMVFGVIDPKLGDVHLTILWKEGKIGSHITDSKKVERHEKYPWDTHINPKLLAGKVQRVMSKWVRPRPYHPGRKVWLFPRQLEQKLGELGSFSVTKTSIEMNAILSLANIRRWKKVRIRDLLGKGRLAIVDSPTWSFVIPVSESQMLVIPCGSTARLQSMIARAYGFENYFEYLESESTFARP